MRLTEFAPALVSESAPVSKSIVYGPAQWAHRSWTSGFARSDFVLQPDGTVRCPADHPLMVQERRPERNGSLRIVYGARMIHCRCCLLRPQCQNATTTKPRQVSAVFWPVESSSSPPAVPAIYSAEASPTGALTNSKLRAVWINRRE